MAHKWKFTVNDDGSLSAEIVSPDFSVEEREDRRIAHLRDVLKMKNLLREVIQLSETSAGLANLSNRWLDEAREATR